MNFFSFNLFVLLIKTFFLSSFIIVNNCLANTELQKTQFNSFNKVTFDVVSKELLIDNAFPDSVKDPLKYWFDNYVKIDGFEGKMTFSTSNYKEILSNITDGKRVDISFKFKILIEKSSLSQEKVIEGNVSSYGTLTGIFSLNDFDQLIIKTQTDLVIRLSKNLNPKI